jgi:nifR3 family TIM-barrel protein
MIRFGPLELKSNLFLSPLAGYTNLPFRLTLREIGGLDLATTDLVNARSLIEKNPKAFKLIETCPADRPLAVQLFGSVPEEMRDAAVMLQERGISSIDINMGCPVRKVRKTGAGAELLRDPELALALARGAVEGSGLPVTVKLRSGVEVGDRSGFELAVRLAEETGVAAIGFHPRAATVGHKGSPDYALTRELVERIDIPVIVSGGLKSAAAARRAYEESAADAVMIARGSLGNPWVFEELTGRRTEPPDREEVAAELLWVIDCAEQHLGTERAGRYLRKFYPWYMEPLGAPTELADELQRHADLPRARSLIADLAAPAPQEA